jgi:3',5'-cyclic-AMP phosphodiesterase
MVRIAQVTDPHLTATGPTPGGYDAAAALAAVLARIAALDPAPTLVMLTGDLPENGTPDEYRRLREMLAGFPLPLAAIPGNHDRRGVFAAGLAGGGIAIGAGPFLQVAADAGPVRVLGLDSLGEESEAAGSLCDARLAWVAARLAEDARPVVIFLHHPPFPIGQAHADASLCRDGGRLGEIVARHAQVLAVACGHAHLAAQVAWAGTLGRVCPAVAWEAPLDLPLDEPFRLEPQAPGFELHDWSPSRGLVSHGIRIA